MALNFIELVKVSLIQVIDKSFGFDTAVEEAQRAINAAHVEAESFQNGIGVVKLMGRYSGEPLVSTIFVHIFSKQISFPAYILTRDDYI